ALGRDAAPDGDKPSLAAVVSRAERGKHAVAVPSDLTASLATDSVRSDRRSLTPGDNQIGQHIPVRSPLWGKIGNTVHTIYDRQVRVYVPYVRQHMAELVT